MILLLPPFTSTLRSEKITHTKKSFRAGKVWSRWTKLPLLSTKSVRSGRKTMRPLPSLPCMHWHARFFYKCRPLTNVFNKNSLLSSYLPNLAWRKQEKAPRVSFRHRVWRSTVPTTWIGGKHIPPLPLAESWAIMPSRCGKLNANY
jgi:hypothetical protein